MDVDQAVGVGPWQTVWKRHHRFSIDGNWDRIHARLLAEADVAGDLDWKVSVDSHDQPCSSARDHAGRVEESAGRRTKRPQGGRGRPLVIAVTPGQAGDSPMLQPLLAHLAVDRSGRGVVLQNLRPKLEPTGMGGGVWPNMRWW